jgi:DNA-directed RNA polymerase subunit RPC12/RpoP
MDPEGFVVLLVLILSIAGGLTVVRTARAATRDYPSCGECGTNLTTALGTTDSCPRCRHRIVEAGVWAPHEPGQEVAWWLGVLTLVFGVLCTLDLAWHAFRAL